MFFYPILMKLLSRKIKKIKPDYIIISSFAIAKNITPISGVPMMLYLHSPMQYIWTHYDEYKEKLRGIKGKLFNRIVPKLRIRDLKYTKFDKVYANSKYTAQVAEKLYGIKNIKIKYPRIPDKFFIPAVQEIPQEYYLYVGRLVNFVREADKIIKICNELKVPLIVMGSGPDEVYLKSIAGPSIIFIGRIQDIDEKIKIISKAK
jgi:glycosyltransferase involved in cell wall biosynthesis